MNVEVIINVIQQDNPRLWGKILADDVLHKEKAEMRHGNIQVFLRYGGSFKVTGKQYGLGELKMYYFLCLLTWQITLSVQQSKGGLGFSEWGLIHSGYTPPVNSE